MDGHTHTQAGRQRQREEKLVGGQTYRQTES